jgi:molybdate transport system substrate-binding protein
MKLFRNIAALGCVLLFASCSRAETLRVAAAADLQFAMNDLAAQYQRTTGTKVAISYGSSGNFRTQIENGAPFDLFFSADAQYPQQLVRAGVAEAESLVVYAQGRLVLWAPSGENLRFAEKGFEALKDARVVKIAIANPEHAPYGRAAVAALQKAGVYEPVKSKLVYGETVSQAVQCAESGSAQVGIIALSLTFAESIKSGECWEIPREYYPALEQAAVMMKGSSNRAGAKAFLGFVKSSDGQKILSKYGFLPAETAAKP